MHEEGTVPHRSLIELSGITRTYRMGTVQVHALRGVSLRVESGELLSIKGSSGSGKSTVIDILCYLDHPTPAGNWSGRQATRPRVRSMLKGSSPGPRSLPHRARRHDAERTQRDQQGRPPA
jgi:ABC-type glutathione transport system ATPase component